MFAALKGETFQIEEVTAAYDISRHHLAKVVQSLAKLGYIETRRGRGGGIQLAQKPEAIWVGRLVRQTENASAIVECFDPRTNTCRLDGCCQLKGALAKAQDAFYESLNQHSLASLLSGPQRKRMSENLLLVSRE
jgi:Rrf2 family nitric oxide-sensitive transcriptional repressor